MKLKPKQQERRINELKADERRAMYGRKKQNGMSFKHPVNSALLIAAVVATLLPWQLKDWEENKRLPKPQRTVEAVQAPANGFDLFNPPEGYTLTKYPVEIIAEDLEPIIPKWRQLNYVERRKAARVDKQREVIIIPPNLETVIAPPPLEPPIKKDERWVRNEPKWVKKQNKLKHYVSTGEWKDFPHAG